VSSAYQHPQSSIRELPPWFIVPFLKRQAAAIKVTAAGAGNAIRVPICAASRWAKMMEAQGGAVDRCAYGTQSS
jgi:hypothetical protein